MIKIIKKMSIISDHDVTCLCCFYEVERSFRKRNITLKTTIRGRGYRVKDANNSVNDGIRITAMLMTKKKLLIHESCTNLKREFQSYIWDEKAAQRGEEKPVKANDHLCDALRYFVATILPKWRVQKT